MVRPFLALVRAPCGRWNGALLYLPSNVFFALVFFLVVSNTPFGPHGRTRLAGEFLRAVTLLGQRYIRRVDIMMEDRLH